MDFLPRTDDGLLAFASPMSTKITATPTAFGVTAGQATTLSGQVSVFSTKLAASQDPATRGPAAVLAKEQARVNLVAEIRGLARQIQGTQTVTDAQRQALGLTIRAARTPIPAPSVSPNMDIVSVNGRTVRVKLHDGTTSRRSKPLGVTGSSVFSYTGSAPPADVSAWKFEGSVTRTTFDVQFPLTLAPGATVWLTAFWFNAKSQSGPACDPISTTFGAAGVTIAA